MWLVLWLSMVCSLSLFIVVMVEDCSSIIGCLELIVLVLMNGFWFR